MVLFSPKDGNTSDIYSVKISFGEKIKILLLVRFSNLYNKNAIL